MNNSKQELMARFLNGETLPEKEKLLLLLSYSEKRAVTEATADKIAETYGSFRNAADSDPAFIRTECDASEQTAVLLTLIRHLSRKSGISGCMDIRLDSPSAAKRYFSAYMASCRSETVCAAAIDSRSRIISTSFMSFGSPSETVLSCRELAGFALRNSAKRLIIAHCHTSGSPEPSANDMSATLNLREVLCSLGIKLIDHIIVCPPHQAVSLRERDGSLFDDDKIYKL